MAPSFSGRISTFSSEILDGTKLLIRASFTVSGIPITPIALPGIVTGGSLPGFSCVLGAFAAIGTRESLGLDRSEQGLSHGNTVLHA